MQVLRLGRALLEMNIMRTTVHPQHPPTAVEPYITLQEGAYLAQIPQYWLTDVQLRIDRQIPHHRVNGRVRFKLSELLRWKAQRKEVQGE